MDRSAVQRRALESRVGRDCWRPRGDRCKGQRSVTTPWEEIVEADPDVMVIACCGFDVARTMQDIPILESYPGWHSLTSVKQRRVYVVDGSAYFSRPGPRLVDSLEILAHALHPNGHPLAAPLIPAQRISSSLTA